MHICNRTVLFYSVISLSIFREEVWCERLRDTPLCLEYDPVTQNIFIGLSDGTLAVIEVKTFTLITTISSLFVYTPALSNEMPPFLS